MQNKCIGCGATFQSEDESKQGYIKSDLLNRENTYCLRCFRLRNHNENKEILHEDYLKVISKITNEDALIVHIVDLFDFSATFIPAIKRQTGQTDCIIVGNKVDIFPKSVKMSKVVRWVRHMCNLEGFKPLDVVLTSAKKLENIEELMESILLYYKKRKVFFVGCSNVGKSTLLNALIKRYTNETKDIITTSSIPGTTLDLIEIKLDRLLFVDTPGIFNDKQIVHQLSDDSYKVIMPKKEIKAINYQLNPGQTVFIGGLAYIDFLEGENTTFVFYFSNELLLHRTKTENKQRLIETQIGKLLNPPSTENYERLSYYSNDYIIKDDKKYDIVISGLGFICVKANIKVRVTTVKGVTIYVREAII